MLQGRKAPGDGGSGCSSSEPGGEAALPGMSPRAGGDAREAQLEWESRTEQVSLWKRDLAWAAP